MLTQEEWVSSFDNEGRIPGEREQEIRKRVFYGVFQEIHNVDEQYQINMAQGVEPELRQEVWKYLLGYYSFNSTFDEREALRKQKWYDKGKSGVTLMFIKVRNIKE